MYHNLNEKFNELIKGCDDPNILGDELAGLLTSLRNDVMSLIALAYGEIWYDEAQTALELLADSLTNGEMDEGRIRAAEEYRERTGIEGFNVGDRVRAVFNIGPLLSSKLTEILIEPGDRGTVSHILFEEDQPIEVTWDVGVVNHVDEEEIERV